MLNNNFWLQLIYAYAIIQCYIDTTYTCFNFQPWGQIIKNNSWKINGATHLQDNACAKAFFWKAASLFSLSTSVISAAWPTDLRMQNTDLIQ